MAGTEKAKEAVQGAASSENKPGIQSEIEVGAKSPEQPSVLLEDKTPEWVQAILDSNASVIESNANLAEQNQLVISSLEAFKEHSVEFVAQIVEKSGATLTESEKPTAKPIHFDEDAEYVVADGKSFADKNDITKKYNEGDDVMHLGTERLQSLLELGLIQEA